MPLLFTKKVMNMSLNKILSFFLGTVLSFGIFQFSAPLFAQQGEEIPVAPETLGAPPSAENLSCIRNITPVLDSERKKFLEFIDQHFKNKLANSELMDTALARYQEYRGVIYKKFYDAINYAPSATNQIARLEELEVCENRLKQDLTLVERALRTHVRGTTAAKRTTALTEKIQAINSKLRGMNTNVAELRGYFAVLENKIPFFISQCVQ